MVFIYALIDPFTCKVRYIGKTINLKQRFDSQCNEKSNTHRCNWIQSIIKKGKKPTQVILQSLNNHENWQEAEIRWISIARKYGWNLVNGTDGGDGVLLTPELMAKRSKTWVGRKHKPETLLKLSKSSKGRVKSFNSKKCMSDKMKGRKIEWKDKLKKAVRKFDDTMLNHVVSELNNGAKVIDLATKYNVHRTTISKIKMGTYKTYVQKTTNYIKPRMYHNN